MLAIFVVALVVAAAVVGWLSYIIVCSRMYANQMHRYRQLAGDDEMIYGRKDAGAGDKYILNSGGDAMTFN